MKNSIVIAGKEFPIRWSMSVTKAVAQIGDLENIGDLLQSDKPVEQIKGIDALADVLSLLINAGARFYNWVEAPSVPYKGLTRDQILDFSTDGDWSDFLEAIVKEREDALHRTIESLEDDSKNAVSG